MELYGHDDRQYSALKGTILLTLQNYRENCESCLRVGGTFSDNFIWREATSKGSSE